jgi:excisionase family DNA binding protein
MTLLTAQEVARMLNVSDKLVYRMAKQGKLVPTPVEGCIRFHPDDVDAYLEAQREEQPGRAKRPVRPHLKHIKL